MWFWYTYLSLHWRFKICNSGIHTWVLTEDWNRWFWYTYLSAHWRFITYVILVYIFESLLKLCSSCTVLKFSLCVWEETGALVVTSECNESKPLKPKLHMGSPCFFSPLSEKARHWSTTPGAGGMNLNKVLLVHIVVCDQSKAGIGHSKQILLTHSMLIFYFQLCMQSRIWWT